MSRMVGPEKDDGSIPESIRWFMRSLGDTSKIPPDERAAWEAWSSNPFHAAEFRRVQQLWTRLDDPEVRKRLRVPSHREFERWRLCVRSPKNIAAAACVILMVVAGALRYTPIFHNLSGDARTYLTERAATKVLELSDGSQIILGASTRLSVDYTPSHRLVRLERGEAMFRVARDRVRPFTVLAGTGSITAVGTQFDVRRELDESDRVVVTVSEGAVEVVRPTKNGANATQRPPAPARLLKGEEMTYDRTGTPGDASAVDAASVAAWVEGRLEYRETPLKLVIPRVSRYSRKRIVLSGDGVGDLPFSVSFR